MRAFLVSSFLGALLILGLSPACSRLFLDSPFSTTIRFSERDLNTENIEKITALPDNGTTRIALISDSHQNFDDLSRVIDEINQQDGIDFVICLGDITNLAYNFEYEQFLTEYLRLHAPAVTISGNHDMIGAGDSLFMKIFGSDHFSFVYAGTRFVGFNSNNWENPKFFNPDWLENEVQSSAEPVIVLTHVPLDDTERYEGSTRATLDQVIASTNLFMQLNGHNHRYRYKQVGSAHFLQVPRIENRQWMILELSSSQNKFILYQRGKKTLEQNL